MNYPKLAILLLSLIAIYGVNGQRADLVTKYADDLFDNAQYQKAIKAYKEVLEQQPGHGQATYQLGESYRLTLDYESAQYYYEQLANSDTRFPLAGFYYGSMLKYNGDYTKALKTFQDFEKFMKEKDFHEDDKYRYYYKQARVEIDGCQLAVNQLATSHPDHQFELLQEPLNTPFNDYAAFTVGADSILCLTSARKGGKGSIADNEFGESLVDLFRFISDENGGWKEYDPKDKFDNINSKWGEGSGSFNRDRTKFYYTNCDGDRGDFCHIYVSNLRGGRWSEPKALNFNINEYGFDSQHPNLTPGGDTLFYVSDKEGGQGGLDLWMSINAGDDDWGPSINLGSAINTPFNESSPFYDQRDKTLFFASDGHRGFGGFDIYIAKGNTFQSAEIYNAGLPFNSNRDDMFFFLGNERGYLTSNRDEGMGKFDIWGFNIQSKEEIINEVATEGSIAGRNALFTEDYNFDNRNTDIINQIISRTLSSNLSDVELVLTDEQLEVYNSLSLDDKERIEKIVNARIRKMTNNMMRSIRSEDDFYYQQLSTEKRQKVDDLVSDYIEQSGLGQSVSLGSSDASFYSSIALDEREKLDILLAERLKSAQSVDISPVVYNTFANEDREAIDGITMKYLLQKQNLKSLALSVNQRVFMNETGSDRLEELSEAVRENLLVSSQSNKYQLSEGDRSFYQNLPAEEKASLKAIAAAMLVADLDNLEETLPPGATDMYKLKDAKTRSRLDKILVQQMANLAAASVYLAETSYTKSELISAQGPSNEATYNNLLNINQELNASEKETMKRFAYTFYKSYIVERKPLFIQTPSTVTVDRPSFINQSPSGDPTASLTNDDLQSYNELDVAQKKLLDRIIAFEYLSKAYDRDPSLEEADREAFREYDFDEKTHVEILAKNLNTDNLNNYEISLKGYAFTYYNNLAPSNKAVFNRVVLSQAFPKKNGKYVLSPEDATARANLDEQQKYLLLSLQRFRENNERILTENLEVEAKDVDVEAIDPLTLVSEETIQETQPIAVDVSAASEKAGEVILDLPTFRDKDLKEIIISGKLVSATGEGLPYYPIKLIEHDNAQTVIESYTDQDGNFNFEVKNDEYNISINSIDTDVRLVNVDMKGLRSPHSGSYVNATRAYFDVGSSDLRPETEKLLDEILIEYKENPMKIEIESHTDNTGSENLNIELSKKRAYSSFDYLIANGVSKSDISVIWHGQEKPIASNTNPFGRQLNRRLDIRLYTTQLNIDFGHFFLVQPGATIFSIAKNFNLSVDDLKKINGLSSNELSAYQPIRVKSLKNVSPDPSLVVPADISSVSSDFTYTVQQGDDIHKISRKFNVPEELILEINELSTPYGITPGKRLVIYPGN